MNSRLHTQQRSERHPTQRHSLSCIMLAVLVSMASMAGCGNAPRGIPRGGISGKVTLLDAPVTEGMINFFSGETGIAAGVKLDSEGTFLIPDGIEVGSYAVTITPAYEEEPPGLAPVAKSNRVLSNIPRKYRSNDSSDLMAEVKIGANYYEFKMVN